MTDSKIDSDNEILRTINMKDSYVESTSRDDPRNSVTRRKNSPSLNVEILKGKTNFEPNSPGRRRNENTSSRSPERQSKHRSSNSPGYRSRNKSSNSPLYQSRNLPQTSSRYQTKNKALNTSREQSRNRISNSSAIRSRSRSGNSKGHIKSSLERLLKRYNLNELSPPPADTKIPADSHTFNSTITTYKQPRHKKIPLEKQTESPLRSPRNKYPYKYKMAKTIGESKVSNGFSDLPNNQTGGYTKSIPRTFGESRVSNVYSDYHENQTNDFTKAYENNVITESSDSDADDLNVHYLEATPSNMHTSQIRASHIDNESSKPKLNSNNEHKDSPHSKQKSI